MLVRLRGTAPLVARPTSLTLAVLGLGLLLGACSTTSMASPADDPAAATDDPATTASTVPLATLPPSTASTVPPTEPATVPSTVPVTEPVVTEPPATAPPPTEPPPPTVPPNVVIVPAMTEPLAPVGTSSGSDTARAQWRLLELGFWVQNADGEYGLTTRQAVMAFQKYYGLEADGILGEQTAALMSAITERPRGRTDAGTLVEVDKSKQLLFFVQDGITQWILNTSTGTEIPYEEPNKNDPTKIEKGDSVTPVGLFDVYRERPEGWWEGDLGEIYRPKYFRGGVAVHGSNSIPAYPASHGCVRVSVPAMDWIWDSNLMPMDTPVWVHGQIPAV